MRSHGRAGDFGSTRRDSEAPHAGAGGGNCPYDGAGMKSPTRLIENGDFISRKPKEFLFIEIL